MKEFLTTATVALFLASGMSAGASTFSFEGHDHDDGPAFHNFYGSEAEARDAGVFEDPEEFELFGTKWGSPVFGTGADVTVSYMATGTSCAVVTGCSTITSFADFMPAGWEQAVEAAFDAWEAVADISFSFVADDGAAMNSPTNSGDIRIGGFNIDGGGGVLAQAFFPPPNGASIAGDIMFDISETWDATLNAFSPTFGDFSLFQVMAHEIGHAIGLRHTQVPMSLMNAFYSENFLGLQADDIAGAVDIYGAPVVQPPQVPLPAGLPLMASGFALAGLIGMRRRAK